MIKFTRQSVRPDGETLYRLERDDVVIRDGITLDEVIYAINRMDEERAGLRRGPMRASVPTERGGPTAQDLEVPRGRGV